MTGSETLDFARRSRLALVIVHSKIHPQRFYELGIKRSN